MRIATTLFLGAAALVAATAAIAQGTPAVPAANTPAPRQTLAAAAPAGAIAPAVKPAAAPAKAEDGPPTTDGPAANPSAPATTASAEPGFEPAIQEAKNNDAAATPSIHPDDTDGIAATVNDESISDYELRQRVSLYIATSLQGQHLTPEQKKRITSQILENLESEKLQLQEAVKKKITVSPVEVDKRINALLTDNKLTIQQLRNSLTQAGASEEALRAQITASIAWMKAVQDEYGDRVNVTPEMVDAEMAKYAEGAHKAHFLVSEIFLPVDNPEQDAKVKKDAQEVENQLRQGAPFPMVARQFSQHPTAATGGDIGWVYDGQLAPELNAALAKMEPGAISPAIRSTGGYYILGLRQRQEPMGTKIAEAPTGPSGPNGTLPLARLLFPISPKAPKAELDNVMGVATQIQERFGGCEMLDQLHNKLPGSIYMNLGDMKLAELSPQIQKAMAGTKPGEAAQPFMSEAGIELIVRCDKRVPVLTAYVMPTRNQIEDDLFQTQISTMARRYLRDLKRAANIQVRDDSKTDALVR